METLRRSYRKLGTQLETRWRKLKRTASQNYRRLVYLTARLVQRFRNILLFAGHRIATWVGELSATLMAIVLAGTWTTYVPANFLAGTSIKVSEVHLACAGIIGTTLALVLTISVIPAQKAADVFSAAILKLYQRDRVTRSVFATMSLLALLSLLLGTNWTFGISPRYTLAAQFVALGTTLDALRAFYNRALDLLVPATALDIVKSECSRYIKLMRREATHLARIHGLSGETAPADPSVVRWLFYSHSSLPAHLTSWTRQLEEFAHKAISRRDTQATNAIVETLAAIGMEYADSRRDSLMLVPDFSAQTLSSESDISGVLNPIYESILSICQDAIKQSDEAIAKACLNTLGNMAGFAATMIHTLPPGWKSSPLAHSPIFYFQLCAKRAAEAGMDDALLTATRATKPLFDQMSASIDTRTAEVTAIDCLYTIAVSSYPRQAIVPCYAAVEMMMLAAKREIAVREFDPVSLFQTVLSDVALLVPFEAIMDLAGQRQMKTFPPYLLSFEGCIPALLEDVAKQIKPVDPQRAWIDPFSDFEKACELVVDHYRDVAGKVSFGGSLLQKWIVDSLIRATRIHLNLLASPPEGADTFLKTVDERLSWFIYAPSFFFNEKEKFPAWHAASAAGKLAVLGMQLLRIDRLETELVEACGKSIASIGAKCVQALPDHSFDIADILENLEILARAAEAYDFTELATTLRSQVVRPQSIADEKLGFYNEAIQTRLRQLDEALDEFRRHPTGDEDPVELLRYILRERRSHDNTD